MAMWFFKFLRKRAGAYGCANPAQVLRTAGDKPVAVLSHNRPAFYMVTPKLFQLLVDELADRDLVEIARERLTRRHTAIDVEIDQI